MPVYESFVEGAKAYTVLRSDQGPEGPWVVAQEEVIAKANAGIPHWHGTELVYSGSPDVMGAHAHRVRAAGVAIIGGCCGNDPSHLAAIRGVLDGTLPVPEVDFTPAERPATTTRRRSRRRG